MPKVAVYNMEGKQIEELDLNENIFGTEINVPLMHSAVLANRSALPEEAPTAPRPAAMYRAAGKSPGAKRAPAAPGSAPAGTRCGPAAVWPSAPIPGNTVSKCRRKCGRPH